MLYRNEKRNSQNLYHCIKTNLNKAWIPDNKKFFLLISDLKSKLHTNTKNVFTFFDKSDLWNM